MPATSRWRNMRWKRRALQFSGVLILTILSIIGQDLWTQGRGTEIMGSWLAKAYGQLVVILWPHGAYLLVLAIILATLLNTRSKLRSIYLKLPGLAERPPASYIWYDKKKRDRWENIDSVRFGHIRYPGLLNYDDFDTPEGFGIRLIRELFNNKQSEHESVKILASPEKSEWKDVLEKLELGEFDIVATPMLETFERTSRADFTMPMFFSNIGLYMSAVAVGAGKEGGGGFKDESLDSVVKKLARRTETKIKIYYVPGEISEKQGRKLHDRLCEVRKEGVKLVAAGNSIGTMLEQVEQSDNDVRLAFCESFHVQRIGKQPHGTPYRLVNVLETYHILYPVCYAIRNGDYILRNRLNIGLLRMAAEGDGIVRRLAESLKLSRESLQAHFVSGWTDPRTREARA